MMLKKNKTGYTLIEALIVLGILGFVIVVLGSTFTASFRGINNAKARIVGVTVANEQLERIRNMPYDDIGTTTGWPNGTILADSTITRSGADYFVHVRADYIDDEFDGNVTGTVVGKPVDTVPTDYKRVEVTVTWSGFNGSVQLTSRYAPNGLETETNTGSLLITVFDASGQPVPLADIHVTNTDVVPNIDITNTTDIDGNLALLSLPPSVESYHVEVSKAGYSTDSTISTVVYPGSTKPDATILIQDATEISFSIDEVSELNLTTLDQSCVAIPDLPFRLYGTKLISASPDILKFDNNYTTDALAQWSTSTLEWDDYDISLTGGGYDIAGFSPPNALNILSGTVIDWLLILAPDSAHSLLATINDSNTGLPITGADVRLTEGDPPTDVQTLVTGRGFLQQIDWSGGPGQAQFGSADMYESDDGNINGASAGQVQLNSTVYAGSFIEQFTSTTQEDMGATTADWDTGAGVLQLVQSAGEYELSGTGQSTTLNSTSQLIESATLTAVDVPNGETIRYYMAADGVSFEEVISGVVHIFSAPGNDLRFKVELETADVNVTPQVGELAIVADLTEFETSGILTSSSYDTGDASEYSSISWQPVSQIAAVGADAVRLQLATNSDNATWNFIGPDGTSGTYYTTSNSQTATSHDGDRYVRYRMYLSTADTAYTPIVSRVSIGYTSQCTPPGQVYFAGLSSQTYGLEITHASYQSYSGGIAVDGDINTIITLTPN